KNHAGDASVLWIHAGVHVKRVGVVLAYQQSGWDYAAVFHEQIWAASSGGSPCEAKQEEATTSRLKGRNTQHVPGRTVILVCGVRVVEVAIRRNCRTRR